MIFKSIDSRFYENPVWETPKVVVKVNDDFLVLYHVGRPGWEWARRKLPALGISARLVTQLPYADMIVNGQLVECTPFALWPLKEIGVPHAYDFSYGPDFVGESWTYDPRMKFETEIPQG